MALDSVIASVPGIFMQFDPFSSGFSFRELIYGWESAGVFDFLLPFLLVFAIIFAILENSRVLGGNRGVNMLISIVLGLLVTRFAFVTDFFAVVFANLGIALAGLIVLLILIGLFTNDQNRDTWVRTVYFISLGGVAFVIIASLNQFYWFGSPWWQRNWVSVLWIALLVLAIGAFMNNKKGQENKWSGILKPIREALNP